MSITAKELAKILGLSEAAVSMALNQRPGVSTATRKKVIDTAKANGYDFSKLGETAKPPAASKISGNTLTDFIKPYAAAECPPPNVLSMCFHLPWKMLMPI